MTGNIESIFHFVYNFGTICENHPLTLLGLCSLRRKKILDDDVRLSKDVTMSYGALDKVIRELKRKKVIDHNSNGTTT